MKTIVYHGGTEIIPHPLVNIGRADLDFGPGFYITDLEEQAVSWAEKMGGIRGASPVLNIYSLEKDKLIANSRYFKFTNYDKDWLDFICACRQQTNIHSNFDVIEGGVADDRVINSVKMYMNGYLDAETTLKRLSFVKPNNQICINKQELVDEYLKFESYKVL